MAEYSTDDSQPPRTIGELGRMLSAAGRSAETESSSMPEVDPGTGCDNGAAETASGAADDRGNRKN